MDHLYLFLHSRRSRLILQDLLLITGFCLNFCCNSQTAAAQSVQLAPFLHHPPILQAPAQTDLVVQLLVEEGGAEIASANVLWRSAGGEYHSGDLEPVNGGLAFTIPALQTNPPYLEYCLIVRFQDGQEVTFPLNDPQLNPQKVAITEAPKPVFWGPEFVVLYPESGAMLTEAEVRIAVSVFDPNSTFNPQSLEVFLDGQKIQPAESSGTFILIKLSKLAPGAHEIVLRSRTPQMEYNPDFHLPFSTVVSRMAKKSVSFFWSFTGEERYEDFSANQENVVRGDLKVRGKLNTWDYSTRTYVTSEEVGTRQPQNRFLLHLNNQFLKINLGDTSPLYSDLVLSGKRVRGVELGIRAGSFHLEGVYGDITRGIEASAYRRWLFAVTPYYTSASGAKIGFTFLKAKDDLSSVESASSSPHDNLVAGFDLMLPFFQKKLQVNFSSALSLTAQDIRGGAISQEQLDSADIEVPFDPQNFENLIVINESLSPPNPLGMSSLAWIASMKLNHWGQYLSLNYRSIGPTYRSLGNPYLQNDLAGWNLSDQFALWNRKLFVNVGLSLLHDDLKDSKTTQTTTTGAWTTFSLYPSAPAPQMVFSLNFTQGKNDLDSLTMTPSGTDTIYSDMRRNETTQTVGFSLIQGLNFFDRHHTVTINYNQSDLQDNYTDRPPGYAELNNSSNNFGLLWHTELSRQYSLNTEYSYYANSNSLNPYHYNQFSLALNGNLKEKKIYFTVSGRRRAGAEDLNRWQSDLSGEWEFYPKNSFRAMFTRYFNDTLADEGIFRLYYVKRF